MTVYYQPNKIKLPLAPHFLHKMGELLGLRHDFEIEYREAPLLGSTFIAATFFSNRMSQFPIVVFNILYPQPIYQQAVNAAHEMIHIKQWLDGDYLVKTPKLIYWKGELVDTSIVPYWKHPWEKEPFQVQYKYARELLKIRHTFKSE